MIISSIENLIKQLSPNEFTNPLSILNQCSISQHTRHILEFYQEYLLGLQRGEIDFDARKRSNQLEVDKEFSLEFISLLKKELQMISIDIPILITISTHEKDVRPSLKSSSFRELAYCNEHSVHHMAIIKIALSHSFPNVLVAGGFGIAFSTQHATQSMISS